MLPCLSQIWSSDNSSLCLRTKHIRFYKNMCNPLSVISIRTVGFPRAGTWYFLPLQQAAQSLGHLSNRAWDTAYTQYEQVLLSSLVSLPSQTPFYK